jgi:glycopeptide antibiotics resistance protein
MRRLVLFIAASLVLVVALNHVGYLIGFFAYACFVLWVLKMRRPVPMLAIAVAIIAMVHFVFAEVLGQDLPLGLMAGWLGA